MADLHSALILTVPESQWPISLRTWTSNFDITTLGTSPTAQLTWPVPRGYLHPTDLRTFLSQMVLVPGSIVTMGIVRRMEAVAAPVLRRADIQRAERIAPPALRRIDE